MFTDIERYVHVLTKLNITANQFLLCYLLYTDQKVEGKYVKKGVGIANLYKYASANNSGLAWTKQETKDLVDKGYLVDPYYEKNKTYPDYLQVTDEFVNHIFIFTNHYEEFWDAYPFTVPNFTNPRGPEIKMKACDKDKLEEVYMSKVRTKVLHQKIMDIVRWATENEKLNVGLEKFVRGEQWKAFEQEMEEETDNLHAAR